MPRKVLAIVLAVVAAGLVPSSGAAPEPSLCGRTLIDVVIMLDASGSMGGEIAQLTAGIGSLVADVQAQHDARFGLIVFGYLADGEAPHLTDGSHHPGLVIPLAADPAAIQARLNTLSAGGVWEPWGDALWILNRETAWRPGAQRLGIMITDEPHDAGRRVPGPLSRPTGTDFDGPELYEEFHLLHTNGIRVSAVDAGSGLTTAQLSALAQITGGRREAYVHGSPGLIPLLRGMITEDAVVPYRAAEAAGLLAHHNVPANPVVTIAHTGLTLPGPGVLSDHRQETFVQADLAPAASWARVFESYAGAYGSSSHSHAYAEANTSRVSLAGGIVTAHAIHVEARITSTGTREADGFIVDLRILGQPVLLPTLPPRIDIPDVGTLWILPEETRGGAHPAAMKQGLRLEIRTPSVRETIIVGLAAVSIGCEPAAPPLTAWLDDDAASGADAPASGLDVRLPALVGGRIGGADGVDAYRFTSAGPGHAIVVSLKPSERVVADLEPIAPIPPVDAPALAGYAPGAVDEVALAPLAIELVDPLGFAREVRVTQLTAPVAFEFNPHVAGAWRARVLHEGSGKVNYTLVVAEHALPRVDGEGTLGPVDAPNACGAGPIIAPGAHVGGLYGPDFADALRFVVEPGDVILATLKASENVDGARFGLRLLDPSCVERAAAAWDPATPEGTPRALSLMAADTEGLWTLIVERESMAVGNWHLALGVQQPLPPALAPDAGSGVDAGSSPATAMQLGNGVHEGRVQVADDVDCYRFSARAGDIVAVSATSSPGLDLRLSLHAPGGEARVANVAASGPEALAWPSAPSTGDYAVCVERLSGGGQYVVGVEVGSRP